MLRKIIKKNSNYNKLEYIKQRNKYIIPRNFNFQNPSSIEILILLRPTRIIHPDLATVTRTFVNFSPSTPKKDLFLHDKNTRPTLDRL